MSRSKNEGADRYHRQVPAASHSLRRKEMSIHTVTHIANIEQSNSTEIGTVLAIALLQTIPAEKWQRLERRIKNRQQQTAIKGKQ